MKQKFIIFDSFSNFSNPDDLGEPAFINDDPKDEAHKSYVDPAGWISPQDQIVMFRKSGENLENARRAIYDFAGEIDESFDDPTRQKGFGAADASQLLRQSKPTVDAYNDVAKAKQKADADAKAIEDAKALYAKNPDLFKDGAPAPSQPSDVDPKK